MQPLQTRHWLEIWLQGAQIYSLDELTADDRAYACRVYCTECSPLSGKLRHADTFDLDRPEAEPIFAAAAALQDARRANGELNTTLCGRSRAFVGTGSDGANVADTDAEVTCKFCLAKLACKAAA